MQDRQQECRRLSAAGHGAREHIPPVDGGRDGVGLNRRRPSEAKLLDALDETRMQLERTEGHVSLDLREAITPRLWRSRPRFARVAAGCALRAGASNVAPLRSV